MPVGGFPGIQSAYTRTLRAPVNPYDKSTIVSIFPKALREVKNTISPGVFHLDAGTLEKPALLVVGPSSWWKFIDDEQPILEIPQGSHVIADSLVKDYCNGLVGCNMADSMPGLFWLPGEVDTVTLRVKYQTQIERAKEKQTNFWKALIKFADTGWARTNGNPLCISEEMRLAARELGLEQNKEWMKDFTSLQKVNCKACGSWVNPGYPVCSNCKAIVDPEKAKELGITFAA